MSLIIIRFVITITILLYVWYFQFKIIIEVSNDFQLQKVVL